MSVTKKIYPTIRNRGWRNLMVAATNAALDQEIFTLDDLPIRDPPLRQNRQQTCTIFRFIFPGDVEGIGAVREISWGKVSIQAALFPSDDAERWITVSNSNFFAGRVFASGWLERQNRVFLQSSTRAFACRAEVRWQVADALIEPSGYRDHGSVGFYSSLDQRGRSDLPGRAG
ncbi:hypothetical protein [Roseomonas sp. WA12]